MPPVPEDHADSQVRRFTAQLEKKAKDVEKAGRDKKLRACEALMKRRRQQRLDGLPEEESPSEIASEEDDDSEGDEPWIDTAAVLAHLSDVGSLQGPTDGGLTSRASRAASTPVEEEWGHERSPRRSSTEPAVPAPLVTRPRSHTRSTRSSSRRATTPPPALTSTSSSSARTRGQASAEKTPAASSGAPEVLGKGPEKGLSKEPAGGSSRKPPSSVSRSGGRPLLPLSG